MQRAELKVLGGRQAGKTISIEKQFLVGREQDCHLRPKSDLVSRHHCVFTLDDYTLRIRDLGSTNGTLVNNERLEGQRVLQSGDRVRIGNLEFEVVLQDLTGADASPAEEYLADEDSRILAPEDVHASSSETLVDLNVTAFDGAHAEAETEQFIGEEAGDTGTIPTYNPSPQTQQAQWPQMPQQGYYPQYPPGYYPPQGMPYPPQGYPFYPQQPMPYPQQSQTPAPQEATGSDESKNVPQVRLPDPSETGVKSEEIGSGGGAAKNKNSDEPTPSNTAADLLNKMRNRR